MYKFRPVTDRMKTMHEAIRERIYHVDPERSLIVTEANKKYETLQKMSQQLKEKSEQLTIKLEKCPKGSQDFQDILKAADQALEEGEAAFRRAAKAKAKAEEAARAFEQILQGSSNDTALGPAVYAIAGYI